jgi:hypothetical protein
LDGAVLSLTDARRLLGDECPMTDEEVKTLLDQLHQIAQIAFEAAGSKFDASALASAAEGRQS